MKITAIEYTRGYGYMSRANIIQQFKMSKASVDKRIKEIRDEIQNGRYSEESIIKDGGFVFVNYLVFVDYIANRQKLLEPNLRKQVKPFNAYDIAKNLGWYS